MMAIHNTNELDKKLANAVHTFFGDKYAHGAYYYIEIGSNQKAMVRFSNDIPVDLKYILVSVVNEL